MGADHTRHIAIIVSAGRGTRMQADMPKVLLELAGKPVLAHTLELFERHPMIDGVYLVVGEGHVERAKGIAAKYGVTKLRGVAIGGATAQDSIYSGLKFVEERESADSIVLLHDGVRPYVLPEVISNACSAP